MTATSILPQALPVSASADNRLALVVDRARDYAEAAQADNTRPYRVGWNDFTAYCVDNGFDALPATPQTVALRHSAGRTGQARHHSTLPRRDRRKASGNRARFAHGA
jgi:hypothetical protein